MGSKKLSNVEKVGVLLVGLGEDISSQIFKNMSQAEVQKSVSAIQRLGRINQDLVDEVMAEFYEVLSQKTKTLPSGSDFAKKALTKALGAEAAEEYALPFATMEAVDTIDGEGLSRIIRNEHPQTIALILAHTDPQKCGEVLKGLPQQMHADLMMRVAHLEAVAPEMVEEINDFLKEEIARIGSFHQRKIGGPEKVAAVLAHMDREASDGILAGLEERDGGLSEEVRGLMFTFEDLIKVPADGVREIIKSVDNKVMLKAMKTASRELFEHFMQGMSERARGQFQEDLDVMPKTRLADIEEAQGMMVALCQRLEEEGKVTIASDSDVFV